MAAKKRVTKRASEEPRSGSQQRVGPVSKRRWWWITYRWNNTPSEVRANTLTEALAAAQHRAEWKQVTDIVVTEVEVVERRRTVELLKPGSPNGDLSSGGLAK